MKALIALAAAGLLAASSSAYAECAGHGKIAESGQTTITVATTASSAATATTKTTKPGS